MSKASWLWPYCWRKGAERPDLQQCKLPVKEGSRATPVKKGSKATWYTICKLTVALLLEEGSRATWLTTVQITSEEREQSNLTYNSANYQWRKGAERPDAQYCSLWRRPLLEGSKVTWWITLSAAAQTVVGREQSDLIDNTICSCADRCWKGAKRPDGQHYLLLHKLL